MSYAFFTSTSTRSERDMGTLVLLHGFTASRTYWRRIIPALTRKGYNVVSIDLLGFGSARRIKTTEYNYETHIQHIETCIREAEIKPPFVLVGHSMGALLAAHYSRHHKADIEKLILLHPPFYINKDQAIKTLRATGFVYRFLLDSRYRSLGWGLLKLLPSGIAWHTKHGREDSLENVILSDKSSQLVAFPPIDTLLVMGSRDRQVYHNNLEHIATSPLVNIKIIESGHHSPLSKPRYISELIDEFIQNETI